MPSTHYIERVYDPVTLKIMATAFDRLPKEFRESDRARHKLALLVIRYIGRGERDPIRLVDMTVLDFLR